MEKYRDIFPGKVEITYVGKESEINKEIIEGMCKFYVLDKLEAMNAMGIIREKTRNMKLKLEIIEKIYEEVVKRYIKTSLERNEKINRNELEKMIGGIVKEYGSKRKILLQSFLKHLKRRGKGKNAEKEDERKTCIKYLKKEGIVEDYGELPNGKSFITLNFTELERKGGWRSSLYLPLTEVYLVDQSFCGKAFEDIQERKGSEESHSFSEIGKEIDAHTQFVIYQAKRIAKEVIENDKREKGFGIYFP